jgi:hypothetical protein
MRLLVWLAAGLALGIVGWWRRRRSADRERQLMLLCERAGLRYSPIDPFPDLWLPFALFGRGTSRGTANAVWERRDEGAVRAFDLWIEDREPPGGSAPRRTWTCAVAPMPFAVPPLRVVPREGPAILEDLVDGDDVELELEAFDRRFRVRCGDRRFAFAFLDQRMMEALLSLPMRAAMAVQEDSLLLTAPVLPAAETILLLDAARRLGAKVPKVVASLYPPRPMVGPHEDRWLQGHWSSEPIDGPPPLVPPADAG